MNLLKTGPGEFGREFHIQEIILHCVGTGTETHGPVQISPLLMRKQRGQSHGSQAKEQGASFTHGDPCHTAVPKLISGLFMCSLLHGGFDAVELMVGGVHEAVPLVKS